VVFEFVGLFKDSLTVPAFVVAFADSMPFLTVFMGDMPVSIALIEQEVVPSLVAHLGGGYLGLELTIIENFCVADSHGLPFWNGEHRRNWGDRPYYRGRL
jgi:hypothetical protein